MHENVIESGVFAQRGYNFTQRNLFTFTFSVTSKRTIVNAVMSAKTTDDALNLAIVENPFVCTSAPSIEVFSYRVRRCSVDRIEILAIVAVDIDGHPVCAGAMRWIEVAYEQSVPVRR